MNEDHIRRHFASNWMFRLYTQKPIPYHWIIFAVPAIILLVGAITAALLGVWSAFVKNILAFSGPVAIGFALAVYGWFVIAFPKIIENIHPATKVSDDQFDVIIKKRVRHFINNPWAVAIAVATIAYLNLSDLISFWTTQPTLTWPGTNWVTSSQSMFFALYYGFYSVLAAGFLIGNGITTILGSVFIIFDMLRGGVKLAYYRQLRSIGDLSIGLASWSFVLLAITVVSAFFKLNPTTQLMTSGTIQTGISSLTLLAALLGPVLIARQAIIDAKFTAFIDMGKAQYNNQLIREQVMADISITDPTPMSDDSFQRLRARLEHIEIAVKLIDESNKSMQTVEAIPDWPITLSGFLQILGAAAAPIIGLAVEFLLRSTIP